VKDVIKHTLSVQYRGKGRGLYEYDEPVFSKVVTSLHMMGMEGNSTNSNYENSI
jgi:hypothetical protein